MRLSILAAATLGLTLFATAASAAVVPQRVTKAPTVVTVCSDSLGMLRAVHKDDVLDVDFGNLLLDKVSNYQFPFPVHIRSCS